MAMHLVMKVCRKHSKGIDYFSDMCLVYFPDSLGFMEEHSTRKSYFRLIGIDASKEWGNLSNLLW